MVHSPEPVILWANRLFQCDVAVYSARLTCELCMPCSLISSNEVLINWPIPGNSIVGHIRCVSVCSLFFLSLAPETNVLIVALSTAISLI